MEHVYHVAACPTCRRVRVVEDLATKKRLGCPRCGTSSTVSAWDVHSEHESARQAGDALRLGDPSQGLVVEPVATPRPAGGSMARLAALLFDLEGSKLTLPELERAFDERGLHSGLQAARNAGAIKCVQRGTRGAASRYAVQPDWQRLLRRPER